ncbi:LysE/ArgO family amino acid transporter [Bacillus massiliigorillae]|uniref:LysE/ArgO family amino acid transporter n=1 Tax=Bacillus massiliigorillae TaxID=1243664 RepID=UPI00039BAA5D|nr:LysE/ArgO family amino acid transporter [Bacillus massiliigorillae]
MFEAIIHGFILAFGLILPLGVQNVFVFNQGVSHPYIRKALPVIFTASICDTVLISIAILGVSVIVADSYWIKNSLLLIGIGFLLYMGFMTWRSKPSIDDSNNNNALSAKKQIIFAASVSLLNPHAIIDTIGVIGTSSLQYSSFDKVAFALSCILVSWIWFFSLGITGRIIGQLDHNGRILLLFNKISAIVMWGTAIYLARSLF